MKNIENRLNHHQIVAKNLMLYKRVEGHCSKRTDQLVKRMLREEGVNT